MNDLGLYERHAQDWWNADSRFSASLHALNRNRLAEITERLGPFQGTVADLGCGGGLIAEPLARAGATVIGCDLSPASVRVARRHGHDVPRLSYCTANGLRAPLAEASMDLVVLADVLEHVADWRALLGEAARLTRPGGLCYVNTLNRTWRSRLVAVYLAEGLGFVPRGTHDPRMFVTPAEVAQAGADLGWRLEQVMGQRVRPLQTLLQGRLVLERSAQTLWGTYSAWLVRC